MLGYNVKILRSFSTLLYGVKNGGRVVGIPKYSLKSAIKVLSLCINKPATKYVSLIYLCLFLINFPISRLVCFTTFDKVFSCILSLLLIHSGQ